MVKMKMTGENENNLGKNENFSNINQHLPLPFLFPPSLPLLPLPPCLSSPLPSKPFSALEKGRGSARLTAKTLTVMGQTGATQITKTQVEPK